MAKAKLESELVELLRRSELRVTVQRREIMRQVAAMPGHFSMDDLVAALQAHAGPASRATVYRLIPALVEAGVLREVEHGDQHSHYELVRDPAHHEHLICQRCGRVIEFASPAIEAAIAGICDEHGFRQYQHGLEIVGLCRRCRWRGREA